jgi:hypothetical protein
MCAKAERREAETKRIQPFSLGTHKTVKETKRIHAALAFHEEQAARSRLRAKKWQLNMF